MKVETDFTSTSRLTAFPSVITDGIGVNTRRMARLR